MHWVIPTHAHFNRKACHHSRGEELGRLRRIEAFIGAYTVRLA